MYVYLAVAKLLAHLHGVALDSGRDAEAHIEALCRVLLCPRVFVHLGVGCVIVRVAVCVAACVAVCVAVLLCPRVFVHLCVVVCCSVCCRMCCSVCCRAALPACLRTP